MKKYYLILCFFIFISFYGQNTPVNKSNNIKEKPKTTLIKVEKKETAKPKQEVKKEVKKPEVKKPDVIKEKPKNKLVDKGLESLLIDGEIDTSKTKIDSLNIVEEKEEEDTIVIEKIMPEKISNLQKGKAYIMGKKLLTSCNTSKIREFKAEDFSGRILKKFSLDYLSNICININRRFGTFEELLFKEALRVEKHKISIYRFKVVYTKKFYMKELRVYMNDQNKITALKTLPWKPEFKPRKKRKLLRSQLIDSLLIRERDSLFKDSTKILENKNIIEEKVDKSLIIE